MTTRSLGFLRSYRLSTLALLLAPVLAAPAGAGCAKKEPAGDKPAGINAGSAAQEAATPATPAPPAPGAPSAAAPPAAGGEAEAVPAAPDPKQSVSGTIMLPAARKKDVAKGDTIFLVARRAGGPPGPGSMLAVQRLQAGDFPMPFMLSGRDAMIPGTPFEGEVSITARVDKDGDAMTRRKGDVFGQVNSVKVGSKDVVLPLDTLQTEDKTLGGPGAGVPGHGGMPSGHGGTPPGHP